MKAALGKKLKLPKLLPNFIVVTLDTVTLVSKVAAPGVMFLGVGVGGLSIAGGVVVLDSPDSRLP